MVLAAPVSEERTVMQYVGRLLRQVEGKRSVEVADIVDVRVPVFAAQFKKRRRFYEKLGFREDGSNPQRLLSEPLDSRG